jgi:hypothetical protein
VRAAIETEQRQSLEDFEIMLRERRAEEAKVDDERHRNAVAEAEQRIASASSSAQRILDEAQSRVDELTSVRARVLTQLGAMRDVLATLPAQAGISDEEIEAANQAEADDAAKSDEDKDSGKGWPENHGWQGVRWRDGELPGKSADDVTGDAETAQPQAKQGGRPAPTGKRPTAAPTSSR